LAQIPIKIRRIVDQYLAALEANKIPIRQAILFGSYTRGNYNKWSDIDIALVSEAFEGNRIDDRGKIRKITLSISSDIEVLPFNPRDFTTDDPFVREIVKTGIKIA